MNKNILLQFQNVSYAVDTNEILSNIDWSIQKGEHWALIGPNGAGKSTILKLIYGFLWPNVSGKIIRKGKSNIDMGELRKSIGWLAYNFIEHIPHNETVFETVLSGKYAMFGFYHHPFLKLDKETTLKARRIIKKLRIKTLAKRITQTLSQGEIQKVLLARALMSDPYLIMLDEPCAGLDPGARENFLDTLEDYISNNNSPSFIYITHHIEEIIEEFTNIFLLKAGNMLFQGDAAKGITNDNITSLYNHPFTIKKINNRFILEKQ